MRGATDPRAPTRRSFVAGIGASVALGTVRRSATRELGYATAFTTGGVGAPVTEAAIEAARRAVLEDAPAGLGHVATGRPDAANAHRVAFAAVRVDGHLEERQFYVDHRGGGSLERRAAEHAGAQAERFALAAIPDERPLRGRVIDGRQVWVARARHESFEGPPVTAGVDTADATGTHWAHTGTVGTVHTRLGRNGFLGETSLRVGLYRMTDPAFEGHDEFACYTARSIRPAGAEDDTASLEPAGDRVRWTEDTVSHDWQGAYGPYEVSDQTPVGSRVGGGASRERRLVSPSTPSFVYETPAVDRADASVAGESLRHRYTSTGSPDSARTAARFTAASRAKAAPASAQAQADALLSVSAETGFAVDRAWSSSWADTFGRYPTTNGPSGLSLAVSLR